MKLKGDETIAVDDSGDAARPASLTEILPLASLTAVGLLATDLYLPAVSSLPAVLHGTIAQSQATLAVFLICLAASQLLWGMAVDRYGPRRVLKAAIVLQLGGGMACALAPSMVTLIVARAFQGLGVGAAGVVVPSLVRQRFGEQETVRALSWLGIAESLIPALGPVAGAALLTVTNWRASFWVVVVLVAVINPFALRSVPARARAAPPRSQSAGYGDLLRDRVYLSYALGHALCFGALLTFVGSAPQVVQVWLMAPPSTFAVLQVCGVSAFILTASQGGRLTGRSGLDRLIVVGVVLQTVATVAMIALAASHNRSSLRLIAMWVLFCGALGLRGPATMARALDVKPSAAGRAAGLLMFAALSLAAAGTQLIAPFLSAGLMPVALISLAYTVASSLVLFPGRRVR
jgi:MFS family permease